MDNFPHLPTLGLVAAAVVVLIFILNKWLFGPLNEMLAKRQAEVDEARDAFDEARRLQDQRLADVEARLGEARKEAFSVREQEITAGKAGRDEVLAAARADAAATVEQAKAELQEEVDAAKRDLDVRAEELAQQVAERLLGRPVVVDEESN